jgi:hypothetical protein
MTLLDIPVSILRMRNIEIFIDKGLSCGTELAVRVRSVTEILKNPLPSCQRRGI